MPRLKFEELEIGPSGGQRGLISRIGYYAFFAGVAWGFVYLFFQLTRSWQIALGSVSLLVGYMLLTGYWAEKSAEGPDQSMD